MQSRRKQTKEEIKAVFEWFFNLPKPKPNLHSSIMHYYATGEKDELIENPAIIIMRKRGILEARKLRRIKATNTLREMIKRDKIKAILSRRIGYDSARQVVSYL